MPSPFLSSKVSALPGRCSPGGGHWSVHEQEASQPAFSLHSSTAPSPPSPWTNDRLASGPGVAGAFLVGSTEHPRPFWWARPHFVQTAHNPPGSDGSRRMAGHTGG